MLQSKPESPLQVYGLRNLPSGMTESSHLSNFFLTEPAKMDSVLAYAFGTQNENVLSLLTGGIGNVKEIDNREYRWTLHGQNERTVEVSGDAITTGSTPGIAHTPIKFRLAERIFEVTDVLVADDSTQVRISEEPYQDGIDFVYTAVLAGTIDPTAFIAPAMIAKGARFSKYFSTVEEFSSKGGSTYYSAPMELQNQLTTLRKQYAVTRSAATDVMVIELFSEDGQSTKMWTKLAEWTAMAQWYREKDRAMVYTIYNKNAQGTTDVKGENGRPVFTGAGLRQQISPSNIYYYNELTYDFLDNVLLDLSYAATRWGGNHKFVALTGKMGMREFSRAMEEKANSRGFLVVNEGRFISGSGQELVLSGQFVTVKFLNGIELTVKEFAPYDDIVHNRALHPVSGKPLESYRFTLLNFGQKDGKSNIRKVIKKGSADAMWYVAGSTDPMGNVSKSMSAMRSSGIDGYQVHFLTEEGIQMEDCTSSAECIINIDPVY